MSMKTFGKSIIMSVLAFALALTTGCAVAPPGTYYRAQAPVAPPVETGPFAPGPSDRTYVMEITDYTPFHLTALPAAGDALYNRGYDLVRRQKEADFLLSVTFSGGVQDNPEQRGLNTLGGALLGAATGAAIGAATGAPATGAAIGAAGGGALGMVSPAASAVVRIDLRINSFNDQSVATRSRTVDLGGAPPQEVHNIVDNEVAQMLQALPRK